MTCAYDISIPVSFSSWTRILSMSSCTGMVMRFTWVALALAAQVRMAALDVVLQWHRHER